MRVISGLFRGKKLAGDDLKNTRPTMDRVKESFIAMLSSRIKYSVCLDLFAGTGSIGIELLSNGASKCYFVDVDEYAINTIYKNTSIIDKNNYVVIRKDYKEALNYFFNNKITFDIIMLDPPYHENLITPCLRIIESQKLLNNNGIVICEFEEEIIEIKGYTILKEKTYGSKKIMILKKEQI